MRGLFFGGIKALCSSQPPHVPSRLPSGSVPEAMCTHPPATAPTCDSVSWWLWVPALCPHLSMFGTTGLCLSRVSECGAVCMFL